jgi:hypothetical protein
MEKNRAYDLLDLLEVNRDRLPTRTAESVKYLQARWREVGRPTEPGPLQEFLDDALNFCCGVGYTYPKVFLLRLKQLQRGEWKPAESGGGENRATANVPTRGRV